MNKLFFLEKNTFSRGKGKKGAFLIFVYHSSSVIGLIIVWEEELDHKHSRKEETTLSLVRQQNSRVIEISLFLNFFSVVVKCDEKRPRARAAHG